MVTLDVGPSFKMKLGIIGYQLTLTFAFLLGLNGVTRTMSKYFGHTPSHLDEMNANWNY
jgi:hypothetical protein